VDGKPIECREVLKNNTVSKDASSYMAILYGHAARRAQNLFADEACQPVLVRVLL